MSQGVAKADSLQKALVVLQQEKQRLDDERKKIESQISNVEDEIQLLADRRRTKTANFG
jgi:cell division protein FtsB